MSAVIEIKIFDLYVYVKCTFFYIRLRNLSLLDIVFFYRNKIIKHSSPLGTYFDAFPAYT